MYHKVISMSISLNKNNFCNTTNKKATVKLKLYPIAHIFLGFYFKFLNFQHSKTY